MNTTNRHKGALETFKVADKMQELNVLVADKGYDLYGEANVVVAIPSLDESLRHIKTEDSELFLYQRADAEELAIYLNLSGADVLAVIEDPNDMDETLNQLVETGEKLDYVVLLHEFVDAEKNYIVSSLNEETKSNVTVIELY